MHTITQAGSLLQRDALARIYTEPVKNERAPAADIEQQKHGDIVTLETAQSNALPEHGA